MANYVVAMDEGLVSVIIPTYYRNNELESAIESVLRQTYKNCEVIVVDDSGEQYAKSLVDCYDGVNYIGLEENRGANYARSIGTYKSNGCAIQFLDDDDIIHEKKIEKQMALLNRYSGVVYCGFQRNNIIHLPPERGKGNVLKVTLGFDLNKCITSSMLIRTDLVKDILPFPNLPGSDDTYLKIELAKRTCFDFVSEPLVEKRSLNDSRGSGEGALYGMKEVIELFDGLYNEYDPEVKKSAISSFYLRKGSLELEKSGWSHRATIDIFKSLVYSPNIFNIGYFLCAIFGRPGVKVGKFIFNKASNNRSM
ncbi:glycosyltransferase family 2 protein [Natrarchaeobius halalkaliphilus]|uniref:Glycosyltransferase family 2 protein n=1 Tax=Natrarchaeobius halalkaliphilus TaxID=1679091 RepID=A0A3N6LPT6_9EURY|nr:glycosyltransferase family 2 protein [Natrarchaeobius halalkaliphilus]RQG91523.1 glycosyltransferase family 2 protein [Natrarchaeobius halalkaliphilus]